MPGEGEHAMLALPTRPNAMEEIAVLSVRGEKLVVRTAEMLRDRSWLL